MGKSKKPQQPIVLDVVVKPKPVSTTLVTTHRSDSRNWILDKQRRFAASKQETDTNADFLTIISPLTEICLTFVSDNIKLFLARYRQKLHFLSRSLMDRILLASMQAGSIALSDCLEFFHSETEALDLSAYNPDVTNAFLVKNILPAIVASEVDDWEQLLDDRGTSLTKGMMFLQSLNLSNCQKFTGATLHRLLQECDLIDLSLVNCKQFINLDIRSSSLRYLNISKMNCNISIDCPQLVQLRMSYCDNYELIKSCHSKLNCPKLEYLDLSGFKKISPRLIFDIMMHCRQIESLLLIDCGLTDDMVALWARFIQLEPNKPYLPLSYLNMSKNLISVSGVSVLIQHISESLSVLVIRGCPYTNKIKLDEVLSVINHHVTIIKE